MVMADDVCLFCSETVNVAVKPAVEADERVQAVISQHKAKVSWTPSDLLAVISC